MIIKEQIELGTVAFAWYYNLALEGGKLALFHPNQFVEDSPHLPSHLALTTRLDIVQNDVAPAVPRFREGHVRQHSTTRIDALTPDDLAGGQPNRRRSKLKTRRPVTRSRVDADVPPSPPRRRPNTA